LSSSLEGLDNKRFSIQFQPFGRRGSEQVRRVKGSYWYRGPLMSQNYWLGSCIGSDAHHTHKGRLGKSEKSYANG